MFGQSGAPKCPHAVSSWVYYSQNLGSTEEDDSLTVTCGAKCSGAIPAIPAGASVTYDGGDTAGTVVTYTCSGGNKVYAVCGNDGAWTPATVSCDTVTNPAPATTTPKPTTTKAPSCEWTKIYKRFGTETLIKTYKR